MKERSRAASLEVAEREAQRIARMVGTRTPPGWGFLLCLTEFGEEGVGGRMTYVSSCERETIPQFCRELARRLETGEGSLDVPALENPAPDDALSLLARIVNVLLSPMTNCRVDVQESIREHVDEEDIGPVVEKMQEDLDFALVAAREMIARYRPEWMEQEDGEERTCDGDDS